MVRRSLPQLPRGMGVRSSWTGFDSPFGFSTVIHKSNLSWLWTLYNLNPAECKESFVAGQPKLCLEKLYKSLHRLVVNHSSST